MIRIYSHAKMRGIAVAAFVTAALGAGSIPGAGGLVFPVYEGARLVCTAFWWRPASPDTAEALSAGHCWRAHYTQPAGFRVVWAISYGALDVLVARVPVHGPVTYPVPGPAPVPLPGDMAESVGYEPRRDGPNVVRLRLVFRRMLDDSYVYEADRCAGGGFSGSPVVTPGGRVVGVVFGNDRRVCRTMYVFPLRLLHRLRPDLK